MADAPYVFDATAANFPRLVLENSEKGPVVVSYGSPRAGPCLMLMPRLILLAREYTGRFLLVRLNTDEFGALARDHGVVSIPTTKVFRHGRVVDTLHGAESESALRAFVSRHVVGVSSTKHRAAVASFHQGDVDRAVTLAAEAALADPRDPQLPLDLAKLLVLQGRYAQAEALLRALPAPMRADPRILELWAHAGLLRVAQEAPASGVPEQDLRAHPDDLETRYRLAAMHLTHDAYAQAMEQLLEIVRRDAGFRDGLAHAGLLALFRLLGDEDERVRRYRSLLSAALP